MWHFPRPNIPGRTPWFTGFGGWVFFILMGWMIYMCVVILWAEYMMCYWIVVGAYLGVRRLVTKTKERRHEHAT